jgi:hypothetical protein
LFGDYGCVGFEEGEVSQDVTTYYPGRGVYFTAGLAGIGLNLNQIGICCCWFSRDRIKI